MTVELVLTLPFLLIVLIAVVLFSQILMSDQAVAAAASNGAREASQPGASENSVRSAVLQTLDGWRLANDPNNVQVVIHVNGVSLADDPSALETAVTGDVVEVSVKVATTDAVPDMLSAFGISIAGSQLCKTFVEQKE